MYLFLERGRQGERERNINEREKHGSVASHMPPVGPACNPGMCPDRESNLRPLAGQTPNN